MHLTFVILVELARKFFGTKEKKGKEINKNTLNTLKKVQGEDDYDYMPNTTLTKPSHPEQYYPANNLRE